MADLSATLRLSKPTIGGDASPAWPTDIRNDMDFIDEAINQTVTVSIADTNVTLTADGSTSDQARYLRYNFTGALTADRTVTLPANVKVGWASNNTTGGHNVILSAGGATLTITSSAWAFFYCDGTNVTAPTVTFGSIGNLSSLAIGSGGLTVAGNSSVTGTFSVGSTLTASHGIAASGAASTISNGLTVDGGLSTDSTTATFGGSISVPVAQKVQAATGNMNLNFTSNGLFINLSNSGTALFDFQDSTQQFAWGYGVGSPMILAGATGNLTITGTLTQGSDRRIKRRIRRIRSAEGMVWLNATKPSEYELGGVATAGFIAQAEIAAGFGRGIHLTPNPKLRATKDSPAGQQYVMDLEAKVALLTAACQGMMRRIEVLERGQ